jgi:GT2 family glycosyltransferase
MNPSCSVIIATRNRHESLAQVLTALQQQTMKPQWVVVVDSSDAEFKDNVQSVCFAEGLNSLNVKFLDANFNSLTRQKNHAIGWLMEKWQGDYIQILDDDTVPPNWYLAKLSGFLEQNKSFVGASGITHDPFAQVGRRTLKFSLARILGMESLRSGVVTKGGIGTFTTSGHENGTPVEWLHGCAMWRSALFSNIRYLDRLEGSALCEDLEFSIRASRFGHLAVLNSSHLNHEMSGLGRPDDFLHSYRFARNRAFVFHSLQQSKSLPLYYFLPNLALIVKAIITLCVPGQRKSGTNQLRGLIRGTCAALTDGEVL